MSLKLNYQGWSGCVVEADAKHQLPKVIFDPAPDASWPAGAADDRAIVVAITHGHPEHVLGTLAQIRNPKRGPLSVVASPAVCRYFKRRSRHSGDRFYPVSAGHSLEVDGWKVSVFGWEHMKLLPPEWKEKLLHLKRLITHPIRLGQIALEGLFGPPHAPMLGFRMEPVTGGLKPIVYFGEGIHRHTQGENLKAGLGATRVGVLVAAVEPEDVNQLPELLKSQPMDQWLAFEAHRGWRERFGMPQVDLPDLSRRMAGAGISCRPLHSGASVDLPQ